MAADNDDGASLKATADNDDMDSVAGDELDNSADNCKSASIFVLCCSYVCCPFKRVCSVCLNRFFELNTTCLGSCKA